MVFRRLVTIAILGVAACDGRSPIDAAPEFVETHLIVDVVSSEGAPVVGAIVQVTQPGSLTGRVWSRTTNAAGRAEVFDRWGHGLEWMPVSITVQPPLDLGLAPRWQADSVRFQPFPVKPHYTTVVLDSL